MIRFALIGYGYRAKFYIRVAKALPNDFSIVGIYVVNEEDKNEILINEKLFATMNQEEIIKLQPDFVVNTSPKKITHSISLEWIKLGAKVLQETPLALTLEELKYTWINSLLHNNYQIAEQYRLYPYIESILKIIRSNIIGEVNDVYISAMHDYHAYSVLREIFNGQISDFKMTGKKYFKKITRTQNRYEQFTDGEIIEISGTHVVFEWENKRAVYDFSSEQYRSPIRNTYINIRGTRGEITNHWVHYLNDKNEALSKPIETKREGNEITEILFNNQILYNCVACGLNEDETAISRLLYKMKDFTLGKEEVYPLRYAIEDSYVSILMNSFNEDEFKTICSEIGALYN